MRVRAQFTRRDGVAAQLAAEQKPDAQQEANDEEDDGRLEETTRE
jgi:hypothetical protein